MANYKEYNPNLLKLMIRTIEELSKLNTPIIFKGAVILKNALAINRINPGTDRYTTDIDGDWYGNKPSLKEIVDVVNMAINQVDNTLIAIPIREPAEGKSAGIGVLSKQEASKLGIANIKKKDCIFTMDLSIRQNPCNTIYMSAINGISIQGATLQKMFADKLRTVSENIVRRRVKDVYDLYILSIFSGYTIYNTYHICDVTKKYLGDFNIFTNNVNDIKHAYDLMGNISKIFQN